MTRSAHLQTGYVAKAHGLRGEVVVRTFDPASEALFEVKRVFLRRRDGTEVELPIAHVRTSGRDLLVFFEGVTNRTSAEGLVGATVFVFREDLPPPEEGEYFQGDLIGLRAVTPEGAEVGRVEAIWETGQVPTLVIRGGPDGELLVPFVDDFVDTVDIEGGRMVVRPPEPVE